MDNVIKLMYITNCMYITTCTCIWADLMFLQPIFTDTNLADSKFIFIDMFL